MSELLRCPFCGCVAKIVDTQDIVNVWCENCLCEMSAKCFGKQYMIDMWNTRTESDKLEAYREALVLIRDKANKGASAVCASIADRALEEVGDE